MTKRKDRSGRSEEGHTATTIDSPLEVSGEALLDRLADQLNAPEVSETDDGQSSEDLVRKLAERERLVEILTERLENAADELDRQKRAGMGLQAVASTGDVPPELLGEQRAVAEQLDKFHSEWEERYEGPALRRLETGLEEIRSMLVDMPASSNSGQAPIATSTSSALDSILSRTESTKSQATELPAIVEEKNEEKNQPVRPVSRYQPIEIVLLSPGNEASDEHVPLPAQLDLAEATPGDLRDAVNRRDEYISWLCRRVRSITERLEGWLAHLNESTDDANDSKISELRDLIHDQLQVVEVELSLERARLAREESRLKQEEVRLAREREQFEREMAEHGGGGDDTAVARRWQRFMSPWPKGK